MKYKTFYSHLLSENHAPATPIDEAAPCWDGYVQYGMKTKDGKQVPNCVPETDESIFGALRAAAKAKSDAQKPIATPKKVVAPTAKPKLTPEPKTYVVKSGPKTADEFRDMLDTRAGRIKKEDISIKRILGALRGTQKTPQALAPKPDVAQTPNVRAMSPEERRQRIAALKAKFADVADQQSLFVPDWLQDKAGSASQYKKAAERPALAEDDVEEYCSECLKEVLQGKHPEQLGEADYQGRSVPLGKPMRGDVKKFKVFVKDPSTGNVKKVNFGDKTMKIKKSNPARRKSFRARHHCDTNPGPRTKARYWSCRKW